MSYRIKNGQYLGVSAGEAQFFEITGREASGGQSHESGEDFNRWAENTIDMDDFKVIPFGSSNNLPNEIQETIFPNHLAPRILDRKAELLFGQGPYLYIQKKDGTQFNRQAVENEEISKWLQEIEHEDLLIHNATEYYYAEQIFVKIRRKKAGRLGKVSAQASLEKLSVVNCRLAYLKNSLSRIPTHVIIGDWKNISKKKDFDVLPLWDAKDPARYPIAVHYCGFRSFGLSSYVLPSTYGSLPWIKRSTTAPKVIEAFTNNSLNVRYHITSPQRYWDDLRKNLKTRCSEARETYEEKMLEDLEDQIFNSLSEVLSGVENVGKYWHSKTVTELIGGSAVELGWKITPIKQEVKEYVEAQIKVADKSDFAVQAGLGLHASLANVGADGKSDSGSEQLYARINHEQTGLPIPEFYTCKALNDIIRIKFDTQIRIGFYHVAAKREQDVSSSDRITNTSV